MLIDVVSVKPIDNFLLLLEFENGEKKSLTVRNYSIKNLFKYFKISISFKRQKWRMELSYGQMR